jgi:hypothetical protein
MEIRFCAIALQGHVQLVRHLQTKIFHSDTFIYLGVLTGELWGCAVKSQDIVTGLIDD